MPCQVCWIWAFNCFKSSNNLDEREIEFATTFIFNGAIGVINYWVQNEFMDSVDEIARIIGGTVSDFSKNHAKLMLEAGKKYNN